MSYHLRGRGLGIGPPPVNPLDAWVAAGTAACMSAAGQVDSNCVALHAAASAKYQADLAAWTAQKGLEDCLAGVAASGLDAATKASMTCDCNGAYQIRIHNGDPSYGNPNCWPGKGGAARYPTITFVNPAQPGPVLPAPVTTSAPPVTVSAQALRPGTLSFATSRGSNQMQVGDTWTATITGATPNTAVSVLGSGPGGPLAGQLGATDSSGNFSKSGTVTAAEIGNWSETWMVGSATAGSVAFSVVAAPAGAPSPSPAGAAPAPAPAAGFSLSSVPTWGWALAGLGLVLAFGGGGRGR